MNMQAMLMQAQKIQRELQKAKAELASKEFVIEKGGAVKVTVLGNKSIKSVNIDDNALKEDKEMVQDMIVLAINEAHEQIKAAEEEINLRLTGRKEGIGM
ncbi:MAG: YbaB/EbfC family nucleoid-associated protein [Bacilli bacterium]|nr:YbaB/EbfC family nucleoid-associated protein [Bacilli bacterium]MCQ2796046.1 YbaB/EbfC family nucleoid-associated protein [Bacilli bacterium]